MLLYTLRRLLGFIPMLVLLAFLTFSLSFYGPGDPLRVIMGETGRMKSRIKHSVINMGSTGR